MNLISGILTTRAVLFAAALSSLMFWVRAAEAQDCFPACRTGYTCQAGTCVSLCNPPCGAGQKCSAEGTCTAPSGQAPAPQAQPAPQAPPPPPGAQPAWGPGAQPGQAPAAPGTQPVTGQEQAPAPAGAPAWGPGSSSGGSQVWSPETAPPTPLTEEDKARLAARTRLRVALYVAVGYSLFDGWSASADKPDANGDGSPFGGIGVGIRKNFTRALGMHLRLLSDFDSPGVVPDGDTDEWDAGGQFGMTVLLEGGLRLGPVADSAPWYFDPLVGLGGHLLSADATCRTSTCYLYFEFDSSNVSEGTTVSLSRSSFVFTAGAATGFVLGSDEQYDIGLRFSGVTGGGTTRTSLGLLFGWALN